MHAPSNGVTPSVWKLPPRIDAAWGGAAFMCLLTECEKAGTKCSSFKQSAEAPSAGHAF